MIESLNYSLFPTDEFLTFGTGAYSIAQRAVSNQESFNPYLGKVKSNLDALQAAMTRETKDPKTKLLAEADSWLDSSFLAFRSYTEACSNRRKAGWPEAAQTLLAVIRKHGWDAASKGYKAELAAISNIISQIRTQHLALLTLLNALDWFEEMEADWTEMKARFEQKVEEKPKGLPTIAETRKGLTAALKDLFAYVTIINKGTPSDVLAALEVSINDLIVTSLATVKAAGTRTDNQKTDEKGEKTDQ